MLLHAPPLHQHTAQVRHHVTPFFLLSACTGIQTQCKHEKTCPHTSKWGATSNTINGHKRGRYVPRALFPYHHYFQMHDPLADGGRSSTLPQTRHTNVPRRRYFPSLPLLTLTPTISRPSHAHCTAPMRHNDAAKATSLVMRMCRQQRTATQALYDDNPGLHNSNNAPSPWASASRLHSPCAGCALVCPPILFSIFFFPCLLF